MYLRPQGSYLHGISGLVIFPTSSDLVPLNSSSSLGSGMAATSMRDPGQPTATGQVGPDQRWHRFALQRIDAIIIFGVQQACSSDSHTTLMNATILHRDTSLLELKPLSLLSQPYFSNPYQSRLNHDPSGISLRGSIVAVPSRTSGQIGRAHV